MTTLLDAAREADLAGKVYVHKLTRNVTQEHVEEIFSQYGALKSARLVLD